MSTPARRMIPLPSTEDLIELYRLHEVNPVMAFDWWLAKYGTYPSLTTLEDGRCLAILTDYVTKLNLPYTPEGEKPRG